MEIVIIGTIINACIVYNLDRVVFHEKKLFFDSFYVFHEENFFDSSTYFIGKLSFGSFVSPTLLSFSTGDGQFNKHNAHAPGCHC